MDIRSVSSQLRTHIINVKDARHDRASSCVRQTTRRAFWRAHRRMDSAIIAEWQDDCEDIDS